MKALTSHSPVKNVPGPSGSIWDKAKAERNWLVCDLRPRTDNPAKLAKSPVDSQTLQRVGKDEAAKHTFDEAMDAIKLADQTNRTKSGAICPYGLGYLPRPGSAMVGVDMDNVFDGAALKAEIADLVADGETYLEKSPSGNGLRALVARADDDDAHNTNEIGGVGFFADGKKYFTVTGQAYTDMRDITAAPHLRAKVQAYKALHGKAGASQRANTAPHSAAQGTPSHAKTTWRGVPPKNRAASLRDALRQVEYSDYDHWFKITSAIHSASDELGEAVARDIFDDWAVQIGGDTSDNDKHWKSCTTTKQGGTTVATIFAEAEAEGWRSARHVFDMVSPAAASAPPNRRLSLTPASNFDGKTIPDREWLVEDLVPARNVTLLSGDGGTGKSLLALQLAACVATGKEWIGYPVRRGRVIFISAEDEMDELGRRLHSIVRDLKIALGHLQVLQLSSLAGEDALLATLDGSGRLAQSSLYDDLLKEVSADPPALLVLDTLADLFPGNENDRAQARQFIGMLRKLAMEGKCAVLLLAHPSQYGTANRSGTSGSTAWNGSVRSRLYLEREQEKGGFEPDPYARLLTTKKSNYGPSGGTSQLQWNDGVLKLRGALGAGTKRATTAPAGAGSAAQAANDQEETARTGAGQTDTGPSAGVEPPGNKAIRVFQKLLAKYLHDGKRVNSNSGKTYAPTAFSEDPDSEGLTKDAFKYAMDQLLKDGHIEVIEDGPPSKPRTQIVFAGTAHKMPHPPNTKHVRDEPVTAAISPEANPDSGTAPVGDGGD